MSIALQINLEAGNVKGDEITGHAGRKRIYDENVYGFMSDEKLGEVL
jgi:hypothetical protein